MPFKEQSEPASIDGLAALAGVLYGVFLGYMIFSRSLLSLVLGALLGLLVLPLPFKQMALITAGMIMGTAGIGPVWTEEHERRGQRIASILLILLIISGAFGLLFIPAM